LIRRFISLINIFIVERMELAA